MTAAAALLLLGCRAAPVAPAPAVTLSDSKLSATLGGSGPGLGQLTEMKTPTGANVIDPGSPGPVWSAAFVSTGTGTIGLTSATAKCASTAVSGVSPTSATFDWLGCAVTAHGGAVNVTLAVTLSDGLLEYTIAFGSDGSISLCPCPPPPTQPTARPRIAPGNSAGCPFSRHRLLGRRRLLVQPQPTPCLTGPSRRGDH